MLTYIEAADVIRAQNDILILTHKRPDGDTIGCAVGLCAALRSIGKRAFVLPNEDATSLFTPYLKGYLAEEGYAPEFVVSVDIAGRSLFTPRGEEWLQKGIDLSFDHHPSYEGFGRECCVDAGRAACGELIYDVVRTLGDVTAEIALPLYVAVTTDTGCFQYGNTTPDTHRVAAALMEAGIDYLGVNKRHFRTKSFTRMRLESLLIENMELFDEGAIGVTALSLEDMARLGATERDAEDIAAFLGQLEGIGTSVTIRELEGGECKLSVRTGADLNATKVCALLGGGGHAAAAGCTIPGSVAHAREEIMKAIRTVQNG
ncbi:MAG: phosphoesterase RecJ domain-containing protein [Clostridia bacterium]|nr:phosphoesterase RecJ domain-containing protein [Clostridia bacterium]